MGVPCLKFVARVDIAFQTSRYIPMSKVLNNFRILFDVITNFLNRGTFGANEVQSKECHKS